MKTYSLLLLLWSFVCQFSCPGKAQQPFIKNDIVNKSVVFGNSRMTVTLDYDRQCNVSCLEVNGQKVIEGPSGIYSLIRTADQVFSTLALGSSPVVETAGNTVKVSGINYGDDGRNIREEWIFTVSDSDLVFQVERNCPGKFTVEEVSFPAFNFKSINTWEGAFLETGGLAWFYLFTGQQFTYGVHSNFSAFWNSQTDNGLKIDAAASGKKFAARYTRSQEDQLVYGLTVSDSEMIPRFDEDTHRRRFVRGSSKVWSDFEIAQGKTLESIRLTPFNYRKEYNRGKFAGIDGDRVTAVLNTIARIGVIDAKHFGGNSWHTPYGPLCLHEQYIAQFGIGINDDRYLNGYRQCLDFYRDHAVRPDGRVISRWAYDNSDAMPGTVVPKGFYEAQWGYLMDSNPDYVINVAELYDQCGDIDWVAGHRLVCERALDFMLKRDNNGNHLVEMMTDNHNDQKGSDWIDIIWASFENAFVNAELYRALVLWSDIEKQLGNPQMAEYYSDYASKLKISFNKSTDLGGFWDESTRCYVHWRDKDHSIHGSNLVTPVNFMAIAYGICDDQSKRKMILDQIEIRMQEENLFFWPICMYSYQPGDGNDWQFPFPNYENGDIFLSWGSVAVQAYADDNPGLALKYVKNVLVRHSQDGLAFQRYGRAGQDGLGDDILSGNSMAVIGLYHSIYGIHPLYNRFYLNPHLTEELAGTELIYHFRGDKLIVGLDPNRYSVSDRKFKITAGTDFGFDAEANELKYFNRKEDACSLSAILQEGRELSLEIISWDRGRYSWYQSSGGLPAMIRYTLNHLKPARLYEIAVDGRLFESIQSSPQGTLQFQMPAGKSSGEISVIGQ